MKKSTRFIYRCLLEYRYLILGELLFAIVWALDVSIRPYALKVLFDRISHEQAISETMYLLVPVFVYLGMSFGMTLIFRAHDFFWMKLNSPMKRSISLDLVGRLMLHSPSFFHNHLAGALGNKVKDVMSSVPDMILLVTTRFFSQSCACLFALITVWTVSPLFALALFLWIAVFILGSCKMSKKSHDLSKESSEKRSHVTGRIVDIFSNIMNVKLFATRAFETGKLEQNLDEYVSADQKRDWYFMRVFAFQGLSFSIYQCISFFLLMRGFYNHTISNGDFVLITTINLWIVDFLWSFSRDIGKFSEMMGHVQQGLSIILEEPEIKDIPDAPSLKVTSGEIRFQQVSFQYKGSDRLLFDQKSLVIPSGQKVGLVGYSGSGKSTFANLILRLYDISSGSITIDGQDIRTVSQDSLHQIIALIPQDTTLFHRSIMENVRYGCVGASDEEVIEASSKAYADDFIRELPHGYDSLVGERGVKLSGGQRQRIAIARAFLKNAPILILDEATSHLDSLTEIEIQRALLKLMKDATTLVIAHRLSTLLSMDRILVFQSGKIVEDGSHSELVRKGGLYHHLWTTQVGGFLPETNVQSTF